MTRKIGIVGGGASGCSLAWALRKEETRGLCEVTLFHDEDAVGGHSKTINVWFDAAGKGHATEVTPAPDDATVYPVDIGVQFVCPTLYPNLYKQLKLPEFDGVVDLTNHPELKLSGSFGPTLNWGNFPAYQSGPRFDDCYDSDTVQLARNFQHDLAWGPFTPLDGIAFSTSMEQYLNVKDVAWSTNFFRYLLIPYLAIINGYGTTDLLSTNVEDLFPIFVKIPELQKLGPYGSFTSPGTGWDRFTKGATEWVATMAAYATTNGATIHCGKTVLKVFTRPDEKVVVEYAATSDVKANELDPSHPVPRSQEVFDEVVLTTDMTTNRYLLDNADNPLYSVQKEYISADKFALIPGVCYIHQDDECLSPHLRDKLEDGQYVGSYSETPAPEGNAYNLPYNLATTFQTYLMKNILGTPVDCHVSMYAESAGSKLPDPAKVIYTKTWRHGRWVASFFDKAKKELHRVQGLGHVWFAGNNTTVDSEEGALVSAMAIADEMFDEFKYPFDLVSEAYFFYRYFQNMMFPVQTFSWHLGRTAADVGEHVKAILGKTAPSAE